MMGRGLAVLAVGAALAGAGWWFAAAYAPGAACSHPSGTAGVRVLGDCLSVERTALEVALGSQLSLTDLAGFGDLEYLEVTLGPEAPDWSALSDMEALSDLIVNAEALDGPLDLAGLELAPQLRSLTLLNVTAAELAPLAAMPALRDLSLSNVAADALPPLPGLETLSVSGGTPFDLAALAEAVALREVTLGAGAEVSLEVFAQAPALELLSIRSVEGAGYGGADLEPLRGAAALRRLELRLSSETLDLEPLRGLPLERLVLRHDIHLGGAMPELVLAPLQDAASLSWLRLEGVAIADLEALSGLPMLETLWLSEVRVGREARLEDLPSLRAVLFNRVLGRGDLGDLATLPQLAELSLDDMGQVDLTPLANAEGLRILSVWGGQGVDLTPLAGLELQVLSLAQSDVSDLAPLAGMASLERLQLAGTAISDVSPIAELPGLDRLVTPGMAAQTLTGREEIEAWLAEVSP